MNKHTLGPWVARLAPEEGDLFRITPVSHSVFSLACVHTAANAQLIAAAPDLLEALQALECLFAPLARDSTQMTWVNAARAAIAKAAGATE